MAVQPNGDVDRAMASVAASPIAYRSFSTEPQAASGVRANVDTGRDGLAGASGNPPASVEADAFPLLRAALAEFTGAVMPTPPPAALPAATFVATEAVAPQVQPHPAPTPHYAEPPTPIAMRPTPRPEPLRAAPRPTPIMRAVPRAPASAPSAAQAATAATPLAGMFRNLHNPSRNGGEDADSRTTLKDVFRRI
jgi:hypothetical protein